MWKIILGVKLTVIDYTHWTNSSPELVLSTSMTSGEDGLGFEALALPPLPPRPPRPPRPPLKTWFRLVYNGENAMWKYLAGLAVLALDEERVFFLWLNQWIFHNDDIKETHPDMVAATKADISRWSSLGSNTQVNVSASSVRVWWLYIVDQIRACDCFSAHSAFLTHPHWSCSVSWETQSVSIALALQIHTTDEKPSD